MRYFRPETGFPELFLLVFLLAALGSIVGCEKKVCYIPPPYTPEIRHQQPSQQPAPRSRPSSSYGAPEVVEGSLLYLGGPRTIYHEVGPLETVWRISRMYDVTPESIYNANGLKPGDPLKNGQKLVIPNARMLRHVINLYRNPQWKYIIVHHTATGRGNARSIHRSHGDRGFWNGLGYHFLIDNGTMGKGDGQIEMSPRWIRQQTGAHCKAGGMNDKAIGIALVGNFNTDSPTPNQLQSLTHLLKTLGAFYRISSCNILGHKEVEGAKTECPGSRFPMKAIRQSYQRR